MSKRAAIYVRVSRAYREDDDRTTIESQLADCEKYCLERGYSIVDTFIEKDKYRVRGKLVNPSATRKDRPQYLKLLKAAKGGEYDVIIAWKEDRLYRGMYAAIPLAEILDENRNLAVELVSETFDAKMLGIKAAIAKLELDNIRDRMVRGRRAKLERGEIPGGEVRYGYFKNEANVLEINEQEARTVRQLFEWYTQGINSYEISRRLAAAEIPGRKRKYFPRDSILNILYFEGYATGSYTTTLDNEAFTVTCPPIISMDTWMRSLEVRQANKSHRGRNVKEDYLIRGMIYCKCEWKWAARTSRNSRDRSGKWGYYACPAKERGTDVHPECPGTIGSKGADKAAWDFILRLCRNPELVQRAIDEKIKQLHEDREASEAEADRLQRELDKITQERQWVITQARKERISAEDMELQLGALHFQALDLRKKHSDYTASLAVWGQAERLKKWAADYLQNVERGLQALDTPPEALNERETNILYDRLGAVRYETKFDGDKLAALRWAILEEKRRIVRTLLSGVLVVKGKANEKLVIPQLALDIPRDFSSLVYDDQSLSYVEEAGRLKAGAEAGK